MSVNDQHPSPPSEKSPTSTINIVLRSPKAGPTTQQIDLSQLKSLKELTKHPDTFLVLVDLLYKRVLASPQIGMFFANVDMSRLRLHQAHFLNHLVLGQASDKHHTLRAIHKRLVDKLGLEKQHFMEFVILTTDLLTSCGLADHLVAEFRAKMMTLQEWVLSEKTVERQVPIQEYLALLRSARSPDPSAENLDD